MKITRKLILTFTIIGVSILIANSAAALGLMPGKIVMEGNPGEIIERTVQTINPTALPHLYDFVPTSYILLEDGNQTFLGINDPVPSYSAASWISIDTAEPLSIEADSQITVPLKFTIPKDADPGTHYAAIALTNHIDKENTSGVSVSGRVFLLIEITVLGDVDASINLDTFYADEDLLKTGVLSFITKFTNDGNVAISPIGNITIYDDSDAQVKNIIRKTDTLEDGEIITKGFKDIISFNSRLSSLAPGITRDIETKVDGLNLKPGQYKAVLEAYYTAAGISENFKQTAEFEIIEEIIIESFSAKPFNINFPVIFEGHLINNSLNSLSGTATIEIRNIFGTTKTIIKPYPKGFALSPSESLKLPAATQWSSGLGMGYYSANLIFTFNEGTNFVTKTITFWIISWWQFIIFIAIVILLIFVTSKGFSKYKIMKKKLETMESKEV